MTGQVVGSYRIVGELGKGGMGMVYRAEHVQLGRPAALKMLLPQFSTDPAIVQRFFNEARAASAIDHPGIVEIYDFGTHTDGSAYIVMALLRGESLEQRLKRAPMAPAEGANILAQVAAALGAAHAQGIVHRDLKPDNIFLSPHDMMPGGIQVKLLDFGIAKLADEQAAGVKTQTGALIGTPAYMSPEQCMGRSDIDHRTDLYSMGCILFHVLCGRPPFLSEHGTGVMIAAHIRDPAPHPRSLNPHVPDALSAIVMKLLEKEPAARFHSAAALRAALVDAGAEATTRPPPSEDPFAATIAPSAPSTDPDAFAPTGTGGSRLGAAPTTHAGAAAELMSASQPPPNNPRKLGLVIGLGGVLLAGAGVAAFLAVRASQGGGVDGVEAAATPPPAVPTIDASPPPVESAPAVASVEPCPLGRERGPDTDGNCCWPEQAWSVTKGRCLGKPRCPPGTRRKAESCETVAAARPIPRATPDPVPVRDEPEGPTRAEPTFRLDATSYAPGATITARFSQRVDSPTNDRAWLALVEAGRPDSTYGVWAYVKDGVKSASVKAPAKTGAYELRLHTHYPAKSTNVVHRVAVQIRDAAAPAAAGVTPTAKQRFGLADRKVAPGASIDIVFPDPMIANPGERFWVTVVAKEFPDSRYGTYEYVPDKATRVNLTAPRTRGDYQVRLHANYPKKSTNVVFRADLTVE